MRELRQQPFPLLLLSQSFGKKNRDSPKRLFAICTSNGSPIEAYWQALFPQTIYSLTTKEKACHNIMFHHLAYQEDMTALLGKA